MLDLFVEGGWVMYPILAASVLALAVLVERAAPYPPIPGDLDRTGIRLVLPIVFELEKGR